MDAPIVEVITLLSVSADFLDAARPVLVPVCGSAGVGCMGFVDGPVIEAIAQEVHGENKAGLAHFVVGCADWYSGGASGELGNCDSECWRGRGALREICEVACIGRFGWIRWVLCLLFKVLREDSFGAVVVVLVSVGRRPANVWHGPMQG
jgi:hypothetical protein